MSSWVFSIIAGVLTDFSFEWLFLVGLAEPFSEISKAKYLAATSYTVNLGYPKNWIISVCEYPTRRPTIIVALRLYSALDLILDILKLCTFTTNMWLVRTSTTSTTTYRRSQIRWKIQRPQNRFFSHFWSRDFGIELCVKW